MAVVTLVAVLATLDPANSRPHLPQGPGITLDESFNVQMGVYLAKSINGYGLGILDPQSALEVFGNPAYNPDHPPLGRLWLGVFHEISRKVAPVESGDNPFVTIHARAGSACAFAVTVLIVGLFTSARWGKLPGITSSVCLAVMPRLFGHAHLASLETSMGMIWTAAILGTIRIWTRDDLRQQNSNDGRQPSNAESLSEPPGDKSSLLCGTLLGLALLTKIQAILLLPLIAVWALWHWRWRAVRPLVVSCCAAVVVFIAGWPWLWLDLPGHLTEYFGRTTGRVTLNVWYLGESFKDVDAPWHYPWVMTLATVPVGILLLATVGLWSVKRKLTKDPIAGLIVGSIVAPLVLFSLPGVAVYDGVRLFLIVFPGIAILAGLGVAAIQTWQVNSRPPVEWVIVLILVAQVVGISGTTPYYLSYYNAAVGGAPGAARLGLERTYWGDSFSREFLLKLKTIAGANVVQVAPVLHQFQLEELERQAPLLMLPETASHRRLRFVPFDANAEPLPPTEISGKEMNASLSQYLAVFHRLADAPSAESLKRAGWEMADSVSCQGVVVASLWQRRLFASSR